MTYVTVDGLRTWHEVHGQGRPVVLLHGAFAGASSWAAQAPALARAGFKVYIQERRGHAHNPDVRGRRPRLPGGMERRGGGGPAGGPAPPGR